MAQHHNHVRVVVSVDDDRWNDQMPDADFIHRLVAQSLLAGTGRVDDCEVSVVLSNDQHIQILNAQYRGKDKPTNVLAFPVGGEDMPGIEGMPLLLGDVFLAFETLVTEAQDQQKDFLSHAAHLLVHGVLHLCGYDHQDARESEEMEMLEVEILKKFDIADPYMER